MNTNEVGSKQYHAITSRKSRLITRNNHFLKDLRNHPLEKIIKKIWANEGTTSFAVVAGGYTASKMGFTNSYQGMFL